MPVCAIAIRDTLNVTMWPEAMSGIYEATVSFNVEAISQFPVLRGFEYWTLDLVLI